MFSIEHLNDLRAYELDFIRAYLPPGSRILEIGGGTGIQARALAEQGYEVFSVDVPASIYSADQLYPIIPYDGRRLPFDDAAFDLLLSSNVLEHVQDRDALFAEFDRVLKPGGYGVHVMPTGAWRLWTNVANYVELGQRLWLIAPRFLPRSLRPRELRRLAQVGKQALKTVYAYATPPRHGEVGNAFTEIWHFSRRAWLDDFSRRGMPVREARPMGIFYTGHMVFGTHLSMSARHRLARLLGSACVIYVVEPRAVTAAAPAQAAVES